MRQTILTIAVLVSSGMHTHAQEIQSLLQDGKAAYDNHMLDKALAAFSRAIELDAKTAPAWHFRGMVHFKLGKIAESIKDFDKYLELQPDKKPSHWQRGISYYYAGRHDDGRKQFEGYQTFDSNDVENAVWRFMCMARDQGLAKARADMLKIGPDERIPMRQIYDLFLDKLTAKDVLAAAKAGKPSAEQLNERLFYAHLYIGIYEDLQGNKNAALEHMRTAADQHRIGHYMWDVARIHRDLLQRELKK
jgi:lipoprotein NlpI